MFLVKREESRDFNVFLWSVFRCFRCLEERKKCRGIGQRENFRKNVSLLVWGVLRAIYSPRRKNQGDSHCRASSSLSRASSLKYPLIGLILTPLDRSSFLVSKKVWNSKIQRSNQKLWLQEVSRCGFHSFHSFLYISIVLTPILTHE